MGFHEVRQLDQRGEMIDLESGQLFDVFDAVVPEVGGTVTENGLVYAIG